VPQIYLKELTIMARKSVSRWDEIVEESKKGAGIWVGVDVHKSSYAVAVLSSNGVLHHFTTPSDNQGLVKQFLDRGISIKCLVYEAGPTGFGLYRACKGSGIEAMVVAACRVPQTPGKTAKTDKIDCKRLAEYLACGMLKPITVPSEDQEAQRSKTRRRNQVSQEIAKTKERIKSFLLVNGLPEPPGLRCWSQAGIKELQEMEMHQDLRFTLDSYLRQLKFLEEEKSLLEKDIRERVLPDKDVLQSVPGVGPITSSIFRSEIFDPERFAKAEQVTSYIGLAPVISQSGASNGYSRLIPCGQGKLRSVLVEAAWRLLSKEEWASKFYHRMLSHCGRPQKAIVALARKLAVILWRLWLENRFYKSDCNKLTETSTQIEVI
jgi:transposase